MNVSEPDVKKNNPAKTIHLLLLSGDRYVSLCKEANLGGVAKPRGAEKDSWKLQE